MGLHINSRTNLADLAIDDTRNLLDRSLGSVWDSVDTVVPALENSALFITTKVMATPKQVQSVCPELKNSGANCISHADCLPGRSIHLGHGFTTGQCNNATKTCNVAAWCPLENKTLSTALLVGGEELVLLVKNYIVFPDFNIRRRNFGDLDESYVANCSYNNATDPHCPAFNLGYIIKQAGENYSEMASHGAILSFGIKWDCDLDFHIYHCMPTYSFRRLDEKEGVIVPGWNHRRTGYWEEDGVWTRYLYKHTGIRIVFNVDALARKFSLVQTTINIGSGLGLLGVATILCDFMLYHCVGPDDRAFHSHATTVDAGDAGEPENETLWSRTIRVDVDDKNSLTNPPDDGKSGSLHSHVAGIVAGDEEPAISRPDDGTATDVLRTRIDTGDQDPAVIDAPDDAPWTRAITVYADDPEPEKDESEDKEPPSDTTNPDTIDQDDVELLRETTV
ncbi:P2X purinoceptor 4-like isoform X2 [Paramacrobiotus metropolitanus]|nr:P2X purinoceptor 4-like isoform X2 [Paramacrobiotus metropolitanus]XP_055348451.1 P2X purinoceptor 4-like isoform X2 [Paramacrobiotus metropolitanus]XP_055348452.1 P2X purinoceptor 4-like isoform X2 [Paramacrobiotus metropolitanus]